MNLEKVLLDSLIEQGLILPGICFSSAKVKGTNRPKHWYFSSKLDDLCSRLSHNDRLLSAVTATWCTCRKQWGLTRAYGDTVMPVSHYIPAVTTLKLNCHVSVSMKTCNCMTIFSLHSRSKYRVDGDTKILRSSSKYQSTRCYVPQDLSVFEHLNFPIH